MSNPIKIKPCNANWEMMTQEEKGKHCAMCSKTVVDFSRMNKTEIQLELKKYFESGKSICGHFAAKDVDEIVVEIPIQLLSREMSFHKRFALALILVMGTSLLSCTNNNGEKEKLKEVVITEKVRGIDTISNQIDTVILKNDSIPTELGELAEIKPDEIKIPKVETIPSEPLTGVPIALGEVIEPIKTDSIPPKQICENPPIKDSLRENRPEIMGKIVMAEPK